MGCFTELVNVVAACQRASCSSRGCLMLPTYGLQ